MSPLYDPDGRARLLAAADDLLEAARSAKAMLVVLHRGDQVVQETIDELDEAIRKAEGS